jgi:hypothetical protein
MWFSAPVSTVNSMIVASSAVTPAAAVPEYRDHRDCHLAGAGAVVQHASLDGGAVDQITGRRLSALNVPQTLPLPACGERF